MHSKASSSLAFYDSLWENTRRVDQHHKCRIHAIQRTLRSICKNMRRRPEILEPGCGSGMVSMALAEFGRVTGIDQSSVGIQQAQLRVPGHFVAGRLPDIDLKDTGKFDVCVLSQVIEHFDDREQVELLRNIRSHLNDRGWIIVTTPNKQVSTKMAFQPGELQPIENWLDPAGLKNLLRETGYRVTEISTAFNFFPILMSRLPWLRPIRYLSYDLLPLRGVIEDLTRSWGVGDCIVAVAIKE